VPPAMQRSHPAEATSESEEPSDTTGSVDSGEFFDDVMGAVEVVNGYWGWHWSEFFTGTYYPPSMDPETWGLYDGAAGTGPVCGRLSTDLTNPVL
jgi:hypothetical protein